MAKKHMHIKVEDTLLTKFDATCQQHGLDRSETIRSLMFDFVNKYKEEEKVEMKIWSQYFITRQLGAKLLGVDDIEDNYLLNLRDIYGYDEEKLIEAWEEQEYLIEQNEADFQIESGWFSDEGGSGFDYLDRFKNDDYVYELSKYIIKQLGE